MLIRLQKLAGRRNSGKAPLVGKSPLPVLPTITITGITYDAGLAPLGGFEVRLFRTSDDVEVAQTTSDGSGNFSFVVGLGQRYYVVAYKAGSPDVSGASVNTVEGS